MGDIERVTPHKENLCKRVGEDEPVPGMKHFFLRAEKVTGIMGLPESLASSTIPFFTMWRGPFGPSGVTATVIPCFKDESISRIEEMVAFR